MGRHSIPEPDDDPSGAQPGGGADDGSRPARRRARQWAGGHRSADGRRGVSIGVITALITVVVVVAAVILWRFFGSALAHRTGAAAAHCTGDGTVTVSVVADPSIRDQLQRFAEQFNDTVKPVRDRCVSVSVAAAGADAVVGGFIGAWPAALGERPALWVPGSSVSVARLQAATGADTVSSSHSLVSSPVLLALRPELKPALAHQGWAKLPGLQTEPDALAGLKLPGWGSLKLALPMAGNGDAVFLAAEAVAAASAPPGESPGAGIGAVHTLVGGQPKLDGDSIAEAMDALLRSGDPASAPVHAVITTEQQLFSRGESSPDAAGTLSFWQPPGPVPVADYPAVLLNGNWLSEEQVSAASEFARFVAKPDQLADLAQAGFRVEGIDPPKSEVTDFRTLGAPLRVGDDALRASLASALTAPAAAPAVTVMLDRSMTADEGGNTRLANVIAALKHRIAELTPTSAVGLWVFDGVEGRPVSATDPLADQVDGQSHAEALKSRLDELSSTGGGAVSFTTLRLVYGEAVAKFHAGQINSVLVITAGPHTDRTLDGSGLQDFIRASVDPAKPVAVNVIDFGDDADHDTWQQVAQLSGGGYQRLATSDSPELARALLTFMG